MENEQLIGIETKLAYQEKTIKDLNDVVYEQQREIDSLKSTCKNLMKLVKENAQAVSLIAAPADENPGSRLRLRYLHVQACSKNRHLLCHRPLRRYYPEQ